jgi:sugar phosphate isomerase/epimerase
MRYAICNELFEGWAFDRVCATVRELGYTGIEIAPFTLAPQVGELSTLCPRPAAFAANRLAELRTQAANAGVEIVGLHWLLAKTEGLSITSPDRAVRERTADCLRELANVCAELGGSVLVFGSPAARRIPAGKTMADALGYAHDAFMRLLPTCEEVGVTLALEPLAPSETDFLQSAAEASALLERLNHPNARLHLDVKAMSAEAQPIPAVIRQHAGRTAHFHANDPNLRGPGMGAVDFVPIFAALREVGYAGWVSVEVFDFKPDPVTIARDSIDYMRRCAGG